MGSIRNEENCDVSQKIKKKEMRVDKWSEWLIQGAKKNAMMYAIDCTRRAAEFEWNEWVSMELWNSY